MGVLVVGGWVRGCYGCVERICQVAYTILYAIYYVLCYLRLYTMKAMLCYAHHYAICYVVLCYAMLCYGMLCYALHYYSITTILTYLTCLETTRSKLGT